MRVFREEWAVGGAVLVTVPGRSDECSERDARWRKGRKKEKLLESSAEVRLLCGPNPSSNFQLFRCRGDVTWAGSSAAGEGGSPARN